MKLELTEQEVQVIVHSLKKQSWELSNPVINKVVTQARKQTEEGKEETPKKGKK